MVAINLAYTAPINRPSQEPVLTMPQLWAALQHKIRHAEEFVPVITSTEVIEERVDDKKGVPVITRVVTFKGEAAPPIADKDGKVKEVCWEHSPCKVDFFQVDGSTISNVISEGPKGAAAGDLNMTYAFEWLHPEVEASNEQKIEELRQKYSKTAQMAVEKSIECVRRLVNDGTIKA